MPRSASAPTGLLPLVAAVALTIKSIARLPRNEGARTPSAPPQPKELPTPPGRVLRQRKDRPDATCPGCGTSIPPQDKLCAFCELDQRPRASQVGSTLLNWMVLFVVMGAIFAIGALLV